MMREMQEDAKMAPRPDFPLGSSGLGSECSGTGRSMDRD